VSSFLVVFYLAPVRDLRIALINGSLGSLNPFPFCFICGNCLGWTVYGYYTRDPFVVAANLPGLILSIWLNSGASKLQYLALSEDRKRRENNRDVWDASRPVEDSFADDHEVMLSDAERKEEENSLVMVPQERALLRVLIVWAIVIVYVGWFSLLNPANIVGVVVNLNLVLLYGAPLQTMRTVIATKNSESIHTPTMMMNWLNTSFWIAYGVARRDPVIVVPNSIGLMLGLVQGILKFLYPSKGVRVDMHPVPSTDEPEMIVLSSMDGPPENELPRGGRNSDAPINRRSAAAR
jgi:solute carrier family 50 (sugar transporter)